MKKDEGKINVTGIGDQGFQIRCRIIFCYLEFRWIKRLLNPFGPVQRDLSLT